MLQAAWPWIKHQPKSALSLRFLSNHGAELRVRKVMIVAVARKLALWRCLEDGLVPQGAKGIVASLTRRAKRRLGFGL